MAHEEHTPRSGNSSGCVAAAGGGGGGKSSKKLKHNKVPQRGMGVAQLEKIIQEERQMKDVAVLTPNSTNFRPPSIPLLPPLPPNHHPLISESDSMNPNFVPKPTHTNSGGGKNWNGLHNFEGENPNPNPNHHGYLMAMPTNLSGFTYESNPPIWPRVPTITQRSHFQQPCSSLMVNVSLGTTSSTSASSVMNLQIEPPSIQSYSSNKHATFWQEEDKMVGKKRPYPFSVENMPIPSFNCKFPSSYVSPVLKSDELTFCGNGSTGSLELHTPVSRENSLGIGSVRDRKTGKLIEDHHSLTKDFLTLGPSRSSSRSHSSSKKKLPPLSIGESTIPSYQGQMRDSPRTELSNQQPLHSFFPAAKTLGNNNGEAEEHVDLNLKL